MGSSQGPRQERAVATRESLIATARKLFAQKGYHATSIAALVDAAGVTRGALYHHFGDKADLFEAVFREVADELAYAVQDSITDLAANPWLKLERGLQLFLRILAGSAEAQRIVFLDGPVVFGWTKWRSLHSKLIFGNLVRLLNELMQGKVIRRQRPEPLAQLILAALSDAAISIAHSSDREATLADVSEALRTLTRGLRR